jgi:hypothetical protein
LSIEQYFRWLQRQIDACPAIINTIVTFEKRDPSRGYVRGELYFMDGSVLHIREFVSVAREIDRQTYAYQYMTADHQLIFRYDNADHYGQLGLPSHPHHKHDGAETRVVASSAPTLADVLGEIEQLVGFA